VSAQYADTVPCVCGRELPPEVYGRAHCGTCDRELEVHRFAPFRRAVVAAAAFEVDRGVPCAYHAGNLATGTCARCGSFICDLCATPLDGKTYCPACFERLVRSGASASVRARYARPHSSAIAWFVMSGMIVLLIPLGLPLGIVYLVRAFRARRELAEREGRVWAHLVAGCAFGLIVLAETAFFLFALVGAFE
jgi:hypothetical protein